MRIHRKDPKKDPEKKGAKEPTKKESAAFDSLLTGKKGAPSARAAAASTFKTLHRPKARPTTAKGSKKKGSGQEQSTEEAFDQALNSKKAQGKGQLKQMTLRRKGGEDAPTKESESGSTGQDEKLAQATEEKEERVLPEMAPVEVRSLASAYGPGGILKANLEAGQKVESAERAAVANLQMIADKILTGMQIHQAKDRTEVHMQLDLGQLGDAKIKMHRDDKGSLHLSFDALSDSAQLLLQDRVHELSKSLQQKGVSVAEIKVAGTEIRSDIPQQGDAESRQDSQSRDENDRSRGQYLPEEEFEPIE